MKSKKIESIKKRFKNEWLLIKVDRLDKATTTPISGNLLAHNPNREEIYQKSLHYKGLTYISYSEQKLPKGFAYAF